jgi:hypothetical protein
MKLKNQTVKQLENRRWSYWQRIVMQSHLYNPDAYKGSELPSNPWRWPTGWIKGRMEQTRRNDGKV